ncbi:MAG: M20/M25/M40 family metallo-hydrolase, partial [Anaerolineales bacterium]|nr:M20/M25/M40 family metallo-hydrolase [Anaerolineales bacterium]
MTDFTKIDRYIDDHLYDSLAELSRLCAQPSVAAQNLGLEETAAMVARMLSTRGFHVEIIPTAGAPIVLAERKGRMDKTLLIYDHYDVQPPEPLELWESAPFDPTLRDGKLFARGVSDNKGHFTNRLFAIDA